MRIGKNMDPPPDGLLVGGGLGVAKCGQTCWET